MFKRHIEGELRRLLGEYPVVAVFGARQAGKTTLARGVLPDERWRSGQLMDYAALRYDQIDRVFPLTTAPKQG